MSNQKGLSLVEVLVAMSVFGGAAVGICKLAITGSVRGSMAVGSTQQTAMLMSEYTRAASVPAAATIAGVTCDTVAVVPWRFERCTRVTNISSREQRLAIIVQPVGAPAQVVMVNGVSETIAASASSAPFRAESLTVVRAANVGALNLSTP